MRSTPTRCTGQSVRPGLAWPCLLTAASLPQADLRRLPSAWTLEYRSQHPRAAHDPGPRIQTQGGGGGRAGLAAPIGLSFQNHHPRNFARLPQGSPPPSTAVVLLLTYPPRSRTSLPTAWWSSCPPRGTPPPLSLFLNYHSANSPRHHVRDHSANKQPVGFLGKTATPYHPHPSSLSLSDSLDLAYDAMSREIHSTLDTIVVMPVRCVSSSPPSASHLRCRQYSRSGPGGYLRSVIRALPVAILRPTAGAAEALSYTLLGLRNNLDPSARRDEEDMWEVTHSRGSGGAGGRGGHKRGGK
jgi:hypothetical protein